MNADRVKPATSAALPWLNRPCSYHLTAAVSRNSLPKSDGSRCSAADNSSGNSISISRLNVSYFRIPDMGGKVAIWPAPEPVEGKALFGTSTRGPPVWTDETVKPQQRCCEGVGLGKCGTTTSAAIALRESADKPKGLRAAAVAHWRIPGGTNIISDGSQWVEAGAQLPDRLRIFAKSSSARRQARALNHMVAIISIPTKSRRQPLCKHTGRPNGSAALGLAAKEALHALWVGSKGCAASWSLRLI